MCASLIPYFMTACLTAHKDENQFVFSKLKKRQNDAKRAAKEAPREGSVKVDFSFKFLTLRKLLKNSIKATRTNCTELVQESGQLKTQAWVIKSQKIFSF